MHASNELVNADRSQLVIEQGAQLQWLQSPQQGVERRMLERIGDEVALATSIVRYQPQSEFISHVHELGEEFLVLDGVFADEHGSYPAGTYVRNPPGSSHAPFSNKGCTIFVKLRQMARDNTDQIRMFPQQHVWHPVDKGIERCMLYINRLVYVELLRVKADHEVPARQYEHGEELFVVDGSLILNDKTQTVLRKWSWLRNSGDKHDALICQRDSLLWIKRGHLNQAENNG